MKSTILPITAVRAEATPVPAGHPDVVCLSHLRWDFVFQRPQHLLTRCARSRRVFFFEEPEDDADMPRLAVREASPGVHVAVPRLPPGLDAEQRVSIQGRLLGELLPTCRTAV